MERPVSAVLWTGRSSTCGAGGPEPGNRDRMHALDLTPLDLTRKGVIAINHNECSPEPPSTMATTTTTETAGEFSPHHQHELSHMVRQAANTAPEAVTHGAADASSLSPTDDDNNPRPGDDDDDDAALALVPRSRLQSVSLVATLACISFLNTFNSGTLTVALPAIAADLAIPPSLLLWPASVYALSLSCTLLLLGAIADVVGNRPVFLTGCVLHCACTLAVSLARTSPQLIVFRALQGIAMAFCMPTAVSTITNTFPSGRPRNFAFASFGAGSPIGFATGLVVGGLLAQAAGWRAAYYLATAANAVAFVLAFLTLPRRTSPRPLADVRHALLHEFDWIGVAAASTSLALLSYIFAQVSFSGSSMRAPHNIVLVTVGVLLLPFFVLWEGRQERLGRPAILPNSIWIQREFTAVCVTVFLVWAWFNSFGYWATLFFQDTQGLTSLDAALRFLPMVVVGLLTNVAAGYAVDKVPAGLLVLVSGLVSATGPLLYALQEPGWTYWAAGFPGMCLGVISTDLLFNIANLVITTQFPSKRQALAGGVFNTVTQLGNSIGTAVTAMIAASVTEAEMNGGASGAEAATATLKGYRGAFWACFAAAVISIVTSSVGLRKAGKVGAKKDV
ncbi:major facilitator superfamily domain-containing protein [Microdochium bolleyi]|uniref:Major facilitator superfamily domain-containing protein n=1 Tax=Microdochium bolleyi TaxID=196109 RepID=A0A136JCH6_9PEZI|nr:major facilitator superfamily domain-containing protein [Microdochium bolleyi]